MALFVQHTMVVFTAVA